MGQTGGGRERDRRRRQYRGRARRESGAYTLLMASNAITINPNLYKSLSYNAVRDLVPISLAVEMPMILVVNNEVPVSTPKELAELARAQPGKLIVGHAGVGTPAHLAGELFRSVNKVDVQPVSYRGIPALL